MTVYQATVSAPVNIACIKYAIIVAAFVLLDSNLTISFVDTGGSVIPS
jgi:hypothetical protein